jgi:hypothetical protein
MRFRVPDCGRDFTAIRKIIELTNPTLLGTSFKRSSNLIQNDAFAFREYSNEKICPEGIHA